MPSIRRAVAAFAMLSFLAPMSGLHAQGTITITAGATTYSQVVPNAKLVIPVLVDMSRASGLTNLASLTTVVTWGPTRLTLDSVTAGPFGALTQNTGTGNAGTAQLSLFSSAGTTSNVTMARLYFTAAATTGATRVALGPTFAANDVATDMMPLLRVRSVDVCVAPAVYLGDVTGDNNVNIIDAQQIARYSVGLSVLNAAAIVALGDVTHDGNVNIIDAQQIARFSVGLSSVVVAGNGVVTPPAVASLSNASVMTADVAGVIPAAVQTNVIAIGQQAQFQTLARDAANVDVTACVPIVYTSSVPTVASVSASGRATALAAGVTSITATSGGSSTLPVSLTVVAPLSGGSIAINTGNNQSVAAGTAVPVLPSVIVKDASNTPVNGASVVFAVASGGGTITSAAVTSNASGVATVGGWTLGAAAGTNTLTATVFGTGVTGNPVTISATGTIGGPVATVQVILAQSSVTVYQTTQSTVILKNASGVLLHNRVVTYSIAPYTVGDPLTATISATGLIDALGPGTFIVSALSEGVTSTKLLTVTGQVILAQRLQFTSTVARYDPTGVYPIQWRTAQGTVLPSFTVQVTDNSQVLSPRDSSLVTIALLDIGRSNTFTPAGVRLSGTLSVAAVGGVATFTNVVVEGNAAAAPYALTATATGRVASQSGAFAVTDTAIGRFATVSSGAGTSCGLTTVGAVWCWGADYYGQRGDNYLNFSSLLPVELVESVNTPNPDFYAWATVATNGNSMCAVTRSYVVSGRNFTTGRCWGAMTGRNTSVGPVYNNPTSGVGSSMFSLGGGFTCQIDPLTYFAGCFGGNFLGSIGAPNNVTTGSAQLGTFTFATLSSGTGSSCGLTFSGAAYCWGDNTHGALGNGVTYQFANPTPLPVSGGLTFSQVSVGGQHACALNMSGAAYCWGDNTNGQLGNGTTTASLVPTPVSGGITFASISAGRYSMCGLTANGTAYCWGANYSGQLGNGTTTQALTPRRVSGGLTFANISASEVNACGVTTSGTAYCWGSNSAGQIGDGTVTDSNVPVRVANQP